MRADDFYGSIIVFIGGIVYPGIVVLILVISQMNIQLLVFAVVFLLIFFVRIHNSYCGWP